MPNEAVRAISLDPTPTEALTRGRFVVLVAAGTVQLSTLGADATGVALDDSPDSDTPGVNIEDASASIPVAVFDGSKYEMEAGTTIVPNDLIASDAVGRAKVAATGEAILGRALVGGVINEVITVLGNRGSVLAP